ncbi:MAG: tandem-95 repeat protein [Cyclobacteriaceae bacterium]
MLGIIDGMNYSISGSTVTPDLNFSGTLTVQLTVGDGAATSDPFNLSIQVIPVNDKPVITAQQTLSLPEDTPITLTVANLTIEDPDNATFVLSVGSGANYAVAGTTVTPNLNFTGTVTVPVTVSDGTSVSDLFDVSIAFTPVNDRPVISAQQTLSTAEDTPITLTLADLIFSDPDNATGFVLSVTDGADYSVAGSVVTPDVNFNGALSVSVTVSDGSAPSDPFDVVIQVTPVNDRPVITAQQTLSTPEDTPITLSVSNLTISDPDNASGFVLNVTDGANYSVVGNTITPDLNFSGTLTVPVTVSDGTDESASFNIALQITAVNDPPVITAQAALLSTAEETPITVQAEDLTISDPDNGSGFAVTAFDGPNYSVSGSVITPDQNFNGLISVPVTVSDGSATSNSFNVQIQVNPVNDPPVITAQAASLSTSEDTPIVVETSHLTFTDPDNSSGFTVVAIDGINYSVVGGTVTPDLNFSGLLTVQVMVNDGSVNSNAFGIQIQVNPVNDPPVITAQATPLDTQEDTPITVQPSHLTFTDPDNASGFTVTAADGANYSVSDNIVTPDLNYFGLITVPVTISDGTATSNSFDVQIQVNAMNDPPVISGHMPRIAAEDTPLTILLADLTFSDPDNATGFTIVLTDGQNYSISGATVTPDLNYFGPLSVPLRVSDGSAFSNTINFQIDVQAVNDVPVITGQSTLNTAEETPIIIQLSNISIADPDNSSGFTLTVTDGPNFSVSGNTVTPDVNFNGTLTVQVRVSDGTATSQPFDLEIEVNPVNDTPVITGQSTLTTPEETPFTVLVSHITISDPDNTTFTLIVSGGTNYSLSGNTVTPDANFNGILNIPIQVNDGANNSIIFNLRITVTPVNDPPVISGQTSLSTAEDTPLTLQLTNLIFSDPDNVSGFSIILTDGTNYSVSGSTVTPDLNFNGLLTVPVQVNDGTNSSASFPLEIQVNAVNDPPVITAQSAKSITEDTQVTLQLSDLTFSDPDNVSGFILSITDGPNYFISGNTVTPDLNFTGVLTVLVRIHDGTALSDPFNFQITVNPQNDAPVITGQTALSTPEESALTLQVSHLVIADPDNGSFTLAVSNGSNYSRSGNTITPAANFNGTLQVPVTVNDGSSNSNTFTLQVLVTPVNDAPVITGQFPLGTAEDTPLTLRVSDLMITDPDNMSGFTLTISSGANYTFSGSTVTPGLNFNGTLSIPAVVNDGSANSNSFNVQVLVSSVNNAPDIVSQVPLSTNEEQAITIQFSHLTVTDPDNTYPTGFFLNVQAGTNYSVSGTTITPNTDFNGPLSVPVQVNDGIANSDVFPVQIQVNPLNDPPVITGQNTASTDEDQPVTIQLSNLIVTDPDNTYPSGFTLQVLEGTNYSFSGNTVTPSPNFNGTLTVPVRVNDGAANSNVFDLQLQVNQGNDAPVIAGQVALSTDEETPLTIQLLHLTVTDIDNNYPTDFTLTVSGGTNYTVAGNMITPAVNFSGTLTVPVRVNDGTANSAIFNLSVQVSPVNDRPVITGQASVSTPEEQAVTIQLSHVTVTDPDDTYPADFTITALAGSNYTLAGNTVTPATNFNGTLSVPVRVNDGATSSELFQLQVQVTPVNDAPVITGQVFVSALEDQPITIQLSHLIVTDIDDSYPSGFTLEVLPGTAYTVSGSTVTPENNVTGNLTVRVRVHDGAANSNIFDLNVQINQSNDIPVITGQTAVSTNEDQAFTVQLSQLTVTDPDNNYPADFTLSVLSGTNYTASVNTVTPALNLTGTLSVQVLVNDGQANSNTFNLQLQVDPVNDAPSITGQVAVSSPEDQPLAIQLSHLTVSDPDDAYPDDFILTVMAGTNYTSSGNTITPTSNFVGTLTVPVHVNDGAVNSNTFDLQVEITPVNDAPQITAQAALSTPEDTPITLQVSNLTIIDPDNSSGFILLISEGTNYTFSGNVITPVLNFNGTLTVTVRVNDGVNTSNIFNLQIQVTPGNDAPVITAQSPVSTPEDTPVTLNLSQLTFTDIDNTSGFTLIVSPGANYTFSGNTITPASNFNGPLSVPVRVNDGTGSSNPFNLQIQVTPVNDAPLISDQVSLSTTEESAIAITLSHLTVIDPDNTYPAGFSLNISAGDHYTVSSGSVIPELNFTGVLVVPVVVNDGAAGSAPFSLQIQVTPVNDTPVITGQVAVSTDEDQPVAIQLSHLTVSDPDDSYPSGFSLTVLPGTNYTVTGNTIRPIANFFGTLSVPVRVNDGTVNSANFNLQVVVNPVNDAPVITGQVALSTNEDQPISINLSHLTVTDIESTYPSGFTLSVLAGTNYSFSGNTVTPTSNFNGQLTVKVRVYDGSANSNIFDLKVTVNPVNDPPVISGQSVVSTLEENTVTIQLTHLTVTDPDNSSGFSLEVFDGTNYTTTGNTVRPAQNFNGTLSVPAQVSDGSLTSNIFNLQVQVTAVNDPPVIIGQRLLSTTEDTPILIKVTDVTIVDPDNTSGFTLQVQAGASYTFSGNTVTPQLDFNGTINVNVRVSDGTAFSPTFALQVQVGDANDPPVITGQVTLSTTEDEPVSLLLQHLTVNDPDNTYPADFTLNISLGENYSVSGNSVIPAENFFGMLTVPVNVNDGVNNSALFNMQITVNSVNDQPSFDNIENQQVAENSGQHHVTINDISKGPLEDSQSLIFFANSSNTVIIPDPVITYNGTDPTADLVYNLKPNVSGLVTVTLRAVDNGTPASSFTSTFQIEVVEINAAPTINALSDVSVPEDSPMQEISFSGITAGVGETQPLTVTVSTDNPELFDPLPEIVYPSPAASGTLRLHPKPNAFGTAQITITVQDNGSNVAPNVNVAGTTFSLNIQPVNDVPVIQSTPGPTAVAGDLYGYDIVVTDVENEEITFTFPGKPEWLTFAPQGTGKGKLSGNPVSGGIQNITVIATDASGGVATQSYTLDINTRPALSAVSLSFIEDQVVKLPVTSVFFDADGDAMQELKITGLPEFGAVKSGNTVIGVNTPIPASSFASLVYEPALDYFGKDTVRLTASDGSHYSLKDVYIALEIMPLNDAPSVTAIEPDTLAFEVNGEPAFITEQFDAFDPDDEFLTGADIAFTRLSYKKDDDVLLFENTATITGTFEAATGVLVLAGQAPAEDYVNAIRTVQYNHLSTVEPALEAKTVTFVLTDGKSLGLPAERIIMLKYTFTDLKIPSGFTPNGDLINDTWYIAPPGGVLENAVIKVFNHRGIAVYESRGFENPWDGTYNDKLLPADTYFYTIDLKLPNQKTYKGTVTLLH